MGIKMKKISELKSKVPEILDIVTINGKGYTISGVITSIEFHYDEGFEFKIDTRVSK